MLRRTLWWFQANKSGNGAARATPLPRSPYEVLSVTPNTPFEEVKKRYRELARMHHPDMPSGNPHLFREVNAAYNILKMAHKSGTRPSSASSSGGAGSSRPFSGQAAQEEERLRREASKAQPNYNRSQWFAVQYLWHSNGFEWISVATSIFVLVLWTMEALFLRKKSQRYRVKDGVEGLSAAKQTPKETFRPSTEAEIDAAAAYVNETNKPVPTQIVPRSAPLPAASKPLTEALLRSRNQRFSDVKEFLFEYDLLGGDARRVMTNRFSVSHIVESSIPKQCVHVRSFHSDVPNRSYVYGGVVDDVVNAVKETPWARVDAATAGVLMANALVSVPIVSPNNAKWTLVEYRAMNDEGIGYDKKTGHVNVTECLFALKNEKFSDQTPVDASGRSPCIVQRIVVSGSEEFADATCTPNPSSTDTKSVRRAATPVRGGVVEMRGR